MEHFTVQSSNAELVCQEAGKGPAAVLLHAGVADRRSWSETMTKLESTGRLIAYDRRGFGDTRYLPESYSHARDLGAVVSHLGNDRLVLVGNSQGGRISIDFALAHPEKVRALILIGTAITGAPVETASLLPEAVALDEAADEAYESGDLGEANRLETHLWLDGPLAPEGRVGGDKRTLFLDMNARALEAPSPGDEIEPPSAYERLYELAMPTLVIVGDLDMPLMLDRARSITERAPDAKLVVMEGTAHMPQFEEPAAFAELARDFLESL